MCVFGGGGGFKRSPELPLNPPQHADVFSETRGLHFGMSLHRQPYFFDLPMNAL